MAFCSYLTCQDELSDIFPDFSVPKKLTISHMVNCYRDTASMQNRKHFGQRSVLSDDSVGDTHELPNAMDISNT
jgi:hypothetical protein